jgi:ectoine hydroxylase-related dioxygenase (phytanoyl-CoA dioxygenase family)
VCLTVFVLTLTCLRTARSKRIALKELSVFEVKPGKGKQNFHREDQFWPWHHAPHAWSLNMLWAIDDFTDANGATRIIPFSPTGKLRESGREMVETAYDESEVLQAKMPRGSVLLFTGGMVHAAGENTTSRARRCVLSGYQLGWLRTEQKFWAYKPLHEALSAGEFHNQELAELLGHYDERKIEDWVGTDWSGSRFESGYLSRTQDQAESDGDALYLAEQRGYEGNGRG